MQKATHHLCIVAKRGRWSRPRACRRAADDACARPRPPLLSHSLSRTPASISDRGAVLMSRSFVPRRSVLRGALGAGALAAA
ncbi:hypothetical protein GTY88_44985, partial [Streptomyces sp. SID5926]|nr:hypothetical protein [Streptomyces sp. SID5926]